MKVTSRELILAWCTGLILLAGGTYWFAQPRLAAWKERSEALKAAVDQAGVERRMAGQRTRWDRDLDQMRASLPRFPADREVTTEFQRKLDTLAKESGLNLIRKDPQGEQRGGYLYEMSISCTWEGSLEALTKFLFAVQNQGGVMDAQQLTVTPQAQGAQLRGSISVSFAYTREGVPATAAVAPASGSRAAR